ncbi:hypothetical protein, partial [Oleiphilus sp. HI0128]
LKCLARRNIFLINEQQLSPEQGEWVNQYFKDNVLQYINPIMCEGKIDLAQVLDDDITYLAVELIRKGESRYSLVEVPSDDMSRFIELPRIKGQKRRCIIMLDNIIRYSLKSVFKGNYKFDEIHAYSMKMTRDAEYGLSEDIDQSLLEQMSLSIKQRMTAEPVRFVYDREMPKSTLNYLLDKIGISNYDAVIPGGRYHNFRDFISFPNIGRNYLEYSPLPRIESKKFAAHKSSFQAISEGDILLYYPYHKFNHFTEFVRQASYDPKVEHISISIYRVAKKSRIIDA